MGEKWGAAQTSLVLEQPGQAACAVSSHPFGATWMGGHLAHWAWLAMAGPTPLLGIPYVPACPPTPKTLSLHLCSTLLPSSPTSRASLIELVQTHPLLSEGWCSPVHQSS